MDRSLALTDAIMILSGGAAWARNFNTDRKLAAAFQALPASGFVVSGAAQGPDVALVSAAAELKWLNGVSLAGTCEGEFSGRSESYAGEKEPCAISGDGSTRSPSALASGSQATAGIVAERC